VFRQIAISCLLTAMALPAVAHTRPHYGGTLRVEVEGDPWQRPGGLARQLVLDGLTATSVDGNVRPALAVEWKPENDNHRWQFKLRSDVHFHNGTLVSSTNVVAALTAICGAGCPWTTVRAVGSSVIFLSDAPLPSLPELLATDEYRIALSGAEDGALTAGSIGTGPFQFVSFSNGVLLLAANDNCWQGRPFLDSVEIHAHRSIHDQWLDLSVGRADLVEVPAEQLRHAHEQRLNVVVSGPASLLALTVSDTGVLSNANLRASIAYAIDRSALSNVIFQKQGEITGSLLPAELTGYSFLFSTERDLNKAHELRGGASSQQLTIVAEGGPEMQLAAQRMALNLRDAGFNIQVASSGAAQHVDITLRKIALESSEPGPALELMLRKAGSPAPVLEQTPASLYKIERQILDAHMVIPLLYLPCAYGVGGRVRDLRLRADGSPLLAGASLEDAP